MSRVKFVSNHDGGWQGNGFGNAPNSYAVILDNNKVGILVKRDDWFFFRKVTTFIDGVKFDYERHASAKALTLSKLKERVVAFYNA